MYRYENERGDSITLSYYEDDYILKDISGLDTLNNQINLIKGINNDGSMFTNMSVVEREISVSGMFLYNNDLRKKLLRVFNPKLKGKLHCLNNDKVIECYIESTPLIKANGYIQDFNIELICPNPYLSDEKETKVTIAKWRAAFKFPMQLKTPGILMGVKEPSLIVNVFNAGDVRCGMKIEFIAKGTVKNPSLFNVNTREYIKLNRTMIAGEKITINTNYGNKKIESLINGVTKNILNYYDLTSTFLQLDIGDNLFRYDAEENLSNLEVSIYFTNQYLGV